MGLNEYSGLKEAPQTGAEIEQLLDVELSNIQWKDTHRKENLLIDGKIEFWDEGNSVTTWGYASTMWSSKHGHNGEQTTSQIIGGGLRVEVDSAATVLDAVHHSHIEQKIEGHRTCELLLGTASAKDITIKFKVKSNKTGTYCLNVINPSGFRSYIAEYTINAADTLETKTVTFLGCTDGDWYNTTDIGLLLAFGLAYGTAYHGTADTWNLDEVYGTSNQVNFLDSTSNYFELYEVELVEGDIANTEFKQDYAKTRELIDRYFEKFDEIYLNRYGITNNSSSDNVGFNIPHRVRMRAYPSVTYNNTNYVSGIGFIPRYGNTRAYGVATNSVNCAHIDDVVLDSRL